MIDRKKKHTKWKNKRIHIKSCKQGFEFYKGVQQKNEILQENNKIIQHNFDYICCGTRIYESAWVFK